MISIEYLNKQQLLAYLASAEFASGPVVPITPLRAHSHLCNPRLHDDDVLLLLARATDGQLVGYLGVLPDTAFLATGEARHCGWLSCLWVNPAHRGQRIAQQLFEHAFGAWKRQLFITEFTVATEQLCKKFGGFRDLTTTPGIRLYLRADTATLLPPKRPLFARARPLLRLLDRAANAVLALRGAGPEKKPSPAVEYVEGVDAEAGEFIEQQQGRQLTRRGAAELDWVLRNPWLRSAPQPDAYGRRYYFSSVANPFGFHALKLRDAQGQLSAFLVLARRDNTLKVPYCYHTGNLRQVAEVIFAHLHQWRIATFTTFQPELVHFLSAHATPALHKRPVFRKYMVSSAVAGLPAAFELQDGDADCGFT